MKRFPPLSLFVFTLLWAAPCLFGQAGQPEAGPPRAGKPEIMPSSQIRPGMQGTAWTVFAGSEPEPVPIEIIGLWRNAWGPKQDIILAKMGGKVQRTNVAGGMSGSPVYVDGKLIGAVALRLSHFSPDSICGITPIDLMLEIDDFDQSRPLTARLPAELRVPGEVLKQAVTAGAAPSLSQQGAFLAPIETPLTFSGFHPAVLEHYGPQLRQMGIQPVQGGAAGGAVSVAPAEGWQESLQPGQAVSGVLVAGDINLSAMGTVTYNDGQKVLAFGHSFFNLGPVDMPMARAEVLTVLASAFQPNKLGNVREIVGALTQDRHSGILGTLGKRAEMIPVEVKVRTFGAGEHVVKEKAFRFQVFVQQQWTPQLMMITLFNSIAGLNDFRDEATFRLSGEVKLADSQSISLGTMQAPSELPVPAPILLAGWWGEKFNRLFRNALATPRLESVNVTVDLLPERRIATIEHAWASQKEVDPGETVDVKVFLQPYRGERVARELKVRLPQALASGTYTILFSDADTMDRVQKTAGAMNRFMDLEQTVSLINQERRNNRLYVSLVQAAPTLYYADKVLPSLPASMLNLLQGGGTAARRSLMASQSIQEQVSEPFEFVVSGAYPLPITVR